MADTVRLGEGPHWKQHLGESKLLILFLHILPGGFLHGSLSLDIFHSEELFTNGWFLQVLVVQKKKKNGKNSVNFVFSLVGFKMNVSLCFCLAYFALVGF